MSLIKRLERTNPNAGYFRRKTVDQGLLSGKHCSKVTKHESSGHLENFRTRESRKVDYSRHILRYDAIGRYKRFCTEKLMAKKEQGEGKRRDSEALKSGWGSFAFQQYTGQRILFWLSSWW